jgi:hypothetical protein
MFIDDNVTVVGDRMVTINKSSDIEVRLVHTGQVVHTFRTGDGVISLSTKKCIAPVPGHSELIVTGNKYGAVRLWNIGDKGTHACECVNLNAGGHVRQIVELEGRVDKIVTSSTRLMCSYGDNKKLAILHFESFNLEKSKQLEF